jgi:hypothetical protein
VVGSSSNRTSFNHDNERFELYPSASKYLTNAGVGSWEKTLEIMQVFVFVKF